jgi:queuine tRNA-ribosyltransferase
VQGGGDPALRARCSEELLAIGFDGYGFGGWPLDANGHLLCDLLYAVREMIPPTFPMHALGIGAPQSLVACARMGYDLFDCALPTRDARTGRLYVWDADTAAPGFRLEENWLDTLYIDDEKHIRADRPISPHCDCDCCTRYAVGYLRHLRKAGETLYFRLATLHNLRFMTRLIELLRAERHAPAHSATAD